MLRIFLRWDDFQPRSDALDAAVVSRFKTVLDLAATSRLAVMPALFCGHASGINLLPAWALDRAVPAGRYRTFVGGSESPFGMGNPYAGPLLDAQVYFARTLGEQLGHHPAIAAWDIGHAFSEVRAPAPGRVTSGEHASEPASEPQVAEWSKRLAAALAETSQPVTAGTYAGDVLEDRNLRLSSLCAPFAFASMQGSPVHCAFARNRLDPEVLPFLATLTASFSFKPVLVTGFGNPTCPPDKFSAFERFAGPGDPPNMTISPDDTAFATYPCLTEHENAVYCTNVLERLHADGRLGAFWWCWADYADALRNEPPFDTAPHERSFGIIRSDGSEKPVAAALAAFGAQRRRVVAADDLPMISSTYYYRTLPASTKTLYDAFLRFVTARRGAGL